MSICIGMQATAIRRCRCIMEKNNCASGSGTESSNDAKKSDGSWRVCGYFRRVNTVTQLDRYPLPALSSFIERLVGCTVFSKVDLKQAFQQVCVEESSQEKTAIITTLALFKFLRMPFGLKKTRLNASSEMCISF